MSINEKFLDAIELLINTAIKDAGYDKTITAQIIAVEDVKKGKYKCKYQDAIFSAYSSNPQLKFYSGDNVYILHTDDTLGINKTIIGKRY